MKYRVYCKKVRLIFRTPEKDYSKIIYDINEEIDFEIEPTRDNIQDALTVRLKMKNPGCTACKYLRMIEIK